MHSSAAPVVAPARTSANRALGDSTLETATRNYGALPEIVGKTRDVRRVWEFVGADCSARTLVEFDDPLWTPVDSCRIHPSAINNAGLLWTALAPRDS